MTWSIGLQPDVIAGMSPRRLDAYIDFYTARAEEVTANGA